MPTTLKEQLYAGIHQTEKHLPQIKDEHVRTQLTAELDAYLEQVRAATDIDEPLFANLGALHVAVIRAAKQ